MPVATVAKKSRKRHDPESNSPIDGVRRPDLIVGKRPGMRYYRCNEEDAAEKRALGAVKTARVPGGPRMKFDTGSDSDSDISYRGLTLYEMPEKLAAKLDAQNVAAGRQQQVLANQNNRQQGFSEAANVWEN